MSETLNEKKIIYITPDELENLSSDSPIYVLSTQSNNKCLENEPHYNVSGVAHNSAGVSCSSFVSAQSTSVLPYNLTGLTNTSVSSPYVSFISNYSDGVQYNQNASMHRYQNYFVPLVPQFSNQYCSFPINIPPPNFLTNNHAHFNLPPPVFTPTCTENKDKNKVISCQSKHSKNLSHEKSKKQAGYVF